MSAREWRKALARPQGDSPLDSVSDMMSGLMIVFLFVAVAFMIHQADATKQAKIAEAAAKADKAKAQQRGRELETLRGRLQYGDVALGQDLARNCSEFADVDPTNLTLTFQDVPGVDLFPPGSAAPARSFTATVQEFAPALLGVLRKHIASIEEVRVEGHTSSEWQELAGDRAYLKNLELSHQRAHAVARIVLESIADSGEAARWLRSRTVATGQSSNQLVAKAGCLRADEPECEDKVRSRRVTFRIGTTTRLEAWNALQSSGRSLP